MLDTFKQILAHQYEVLNAGIDRCPEAAWDAPVGNLTFGQVAFHTLFFIDLYLGPDVESLRQQPFHRDNRRFFRDYEELEPRRRQHRYGRPAIKRYLDHVRQKATAVIPAETEESLQGPSGFDWKKYNRAELHVTNIRHIQHHAAQLSLRLRIDFGEDVPWVGSGWQ
jgi:DinB superfamily